jgi:hypothetical protein
MMMMMIMMMMMMIPVVLVPPQRSGLSGAQLKRLDELNKIWQEACNLFEFRQHQFLRQISKSFKSVLINLLDETVMLSMSRFLLNGARLESQIFDIH